MSNLNYSLSEILDIDPLPPREGGPLFTPMITNETGNDLQDDLKFARQNIRHLITRGLASAEELITISSASESAKAYEAMTTLIKNLSEMNKDLLQLHRTAQQVSELPVKKGSPQSENTSPISVENAIFVGSTKELAEIVKREKHATPDISQQPQH